MNSNMSLRSSMKGARNQLPYNPDFLRNNNPNNNSNNFISSSNFNPQNNNNENKNLDNNNTSLPLLPDQSTSNNQTASFDNNINNTNNLNNSSMIQNTTNLPPSEQSNIVANNNIINSNSQLSNHPSQKSQNNLSAKANLRMTAQARLEAQRGVRDNDKSSVSSIERGVGGSRQQIQKVSDRNVIEFGRETPLEGNAYPNSTTLRKDNHRSQDRQKSGSSNGPSTANLNHLTQPVKSPQINDIDDLHKITPSNSKQNLKSNLSSPLNNASPVQSNLLINNLGGSNSNNNATGNSAGVVPNYGETRLVKDASGQHQKQTYI